MASIEDFFSTLIKSLKDIDALVGADLTKTDLCNADFSNSNLHSADLTYASFHWADIRGADFCNAQWDEHTVWPEGIGPLPKDES